MIARYFKIAALAAGLSVLYPAPGSAMPMHAHGIGSAWVVTGFELGPWEDYLVRELTPDLELQESLPEPRISFLDQDHVAILPDFAESLMGERKPRVRMIFDHRRSSMGINGQRFGPTVDASTGFRREIVTSGIASRLSRRNVVSVSAVLATHEFGSSELDLQHATDGYWHGHSTGRNGLPRNVTHGAGLRMDMSSRIAPRLTLNASAQTRIDMDELAEFRGLHAQSADLDIPPRASVGMELRATQRNYLDLGIEHIFYSDVSAFPSRALPARFLSLLGDSSSPEFAWDDLSVYSLGWRWVSDTDFTVRAQYSSRTQPMPSSRSLARAIEDDLAGNSFLLGVSQGFENGGQLGLTATYAPPEFAFGGNAMGVITDRIDQSLEFKALMSWRY